MFSIKAFSLVLFSTLVSQSVAAPAASPEHVHHAHKRDGNSGKTCAFPNDNGMVAVFNTKVANSEGWAQDGPCKAGSYCQYACQPGYLMGQWNPQVTSYTYPGSQDGGLWCDENGSLSKPISQNDYCYKGKGTAKAVNQSGKNVAFCQTVLPGNEAMLIPTDVQGNSENDLAVPGTDYWASTASHFYINPPGVSVEEGCRWGSTANPYGNWSPYVAGFNMDDKGNTFAKIGWNPIYFEDSSPFKNEKPQFGIRLKCDDPSKCNGRQTLGMLDYDKRLTHSFTAHPKVDPFTGEMFTFGYSHTPPYITYRVISKDGFMHEPVPITISDPIMMHDFAITENYAIFMDLPLYFRPKEMVKEKKLIFTFDATKKARFGVLPRYAKNELHIKWFELPNCFIFHNANAWEEEDEVVLITCRLENPDLDLVGGDVKEKLENFGNELYEMRFNMKTGIASQRKLSASSVDFPRVNESYTGRKQRYVYGTILDSIAKVTGIIKFDLHAEPDTGKSKLEVGGNVQGIFDLGVGRFGSEAVFVPREPGITSEEDDGYLIFFVHDEKTGKSYVNVIDAKTMSPDPIAIVELPNRVPYGFHAFFVTEEQLKEQAKL